MSLSADEKRRLFAELEARGWARKEGFISAPHGSIWLEEDEPWKGDVHDFLDRMTSRLVRIRKMLHIETCRQAYDDTAVLVQCLTNLGKVPPDKLNITQIGE